MKNAQEKRPDGFDYMSMWESVLDARIAGDTALLKMFAKHGFCEMRQFTAEMCDTVIPTLNEDKISNVSFDWEVCPVIVHYWIESDFNSAEVAEKMRKHKFE